MPPLPPAGVSVPLQLGLPDAIPPQYGALKEVSIHTVRARLRLLYHFSDLMYSSWRLLNLSPNNQVTCFHVGASGNPCLLTPGDSGGPREAYLGFLGKRRLFSLLGREFRSLVYCSLL